MENISSKITETYLEYRSKVLERCENPKYLQVVIQMKPEIFCKLRTEGLEIMRTEGVHWINLCGRKTPIIINDELDNQTEFIMQSQYEYERMEQEKLLSKFYKMFNN